MGNTLFDDDEENFYLDIDELMVYSDEDAIVEDDEYDWDDDR